MNDSKVKRLTPTAVGVASFFIIMAGLKLSHSFINPLLLAFFISIICAQPVVWLKKKKVPSGMAILMVILLLIGIFSVLNILVGSTLTMFLNDVDQHRDDLKAIAGSSRGFFSQKGIQLPVLKESGSLEPSKILHYTGLVVGKIRELVSEEITFLFIAVFLMAEMEILGLKMMILGRGSKSSLAILQSIGNRIRHYLSIKTVTSLATGILITSGLALLGIDYPLLWGLLAFLLNYIPTIGSIVAAIPGVTFSILQLGFPSSIFTIVLYLVVNLVIGNILEPRIMGKGLGLSTTVVFLSLIFWGFILGPVGMFLSVPITIAIKVILEHHRPTEWIAVMLGSKQEAVKALNSISHSSQPRKLEP